MRADQQRVRSLLAEAITILCKNTLAYTSEFSVEGLLGITLDNNEVFLVSIKENVQDIGPAGGSGADPSMGQTSLGSIPRMAPPPPRPARPVPTSRPIPARSPFMPRRPTFGQRGRGRMRGKHPVRPPSRTIAGVPQKRGPPVTSHTSARPADDTVVEVKDDTEEDQEMKTDDSGRDDTATDNQAGDPLSSLDFGDMMQQYENASTSLQSSNSDDTIPHDDKSNDADQSNANGAIVIKPEPGKDNLPTSGDSGVMYGPGMDTSGGMFPPTPSGHVFSNAAMPPSGQFMDPTAMPGFSGWGATGTPPVSTPKRSGPGRPSAAAGSSTQGSPSQDQFTGESWQCCYCWKQFGLQRLLWRHIRNQHMNTQVFQCHLCSHTTSRKFNLQLHVENMHTTRKAFKCLLCGHRTKQKSNIRWHLRKHHPESEVEESYAKVQDEESDDCDDIEVN